MLIFLAKHVDTGNILCRLIVANVHTHAELNCGQIHRNFEEAKSPSLFPNV